jgi:hypothetical protein
MSNLTFSTDKVYNKLGITGLHKIYGSTKTSIDSKNGSRCKFYLKYTFILLN